MVRSLARLVAVVALLCVVSLVVAQPTSETKSATGGFSPRRKNWPGSFDYIVIGSGTAGSVVASRLSADRGNRVLLLERGVDFQGIETYDIPRKWDRTIVTPADDFTMIDFFNEPVVNYNEAKSRVSLGKALGGTTVINSEMWVRGAPGDFDRWANVYGATGWSYNDVLPYFKRAENNPFKFALNPAYHGNAGPVKLSPGTQAPPEDLLLVNAAAAAGYPFNPDINGANQIPNGVGSSAFHDMSIWNGTRTDAYTSYIKPHLNRPNLWVVDSAMVTKINFNKNRVAVSVDWYDALTGESTTSRASREIILSAGAIGSPKLLQLSGIGDADHLSSLNIPVVKHLPGVGENLNEHLITNLGYSTGLPPVVGQDLTPAALAEWRQNRTGPYSTIGGRAQMFFRTSVVPADDPRPDIQVIGFPPGNSVFGVMYLLRPYSRGYVKITSSDPTSHVLPVGNFLTDQRDIQSFTEGLRMLKGVYDKLNTTLEPTAAPWDLSSDFSVSTYLTGYAPWFQIANTNTGQHWSGTCKMGPASDPTAVVDARLRVHGVSRLRVVDASIMPEVTAGNTQAPTYMIGEKAAQMILDDNC